MASRATTSRFFLHIPDCESEHAVEMIEDIGPPLPVTVDDDLGVTVSSETNIRFAQAPAAVL